jgi:hypothetical protein
MAQQYVSTIAGSASLTEFEAAIAYEEGLACKFIKSEITSKNGVLSNLITFQEENTIPKPLVFIKQDDQIPANHTLEWSGVAVISGSNTPLKAYREN